MAKFTPTQGRYLGFIQAYTTLHGFPPAESEIAAAMCVSPPSVNQMVKMLEKKGLINRQPGQARSIEVRIPLDEIPVWNRRTHGKDLDRPARKPTRAEVRAAAAPSGRLYVMSVYLMGGPISEKFANKEVSRKIEIRGDQTLEQLHQTIFKAYDRIEEHFYEFQFGKRPFDPDGPTYGIPNAREKKEGVGDARRTTLDDLGLKPGRVFGYWFDFGDDWFHQLQVDRVEEAIPTVNYPRIIGRVGKSPPQYREED